MKLSFTFLVVTLASLGSAAPTEDAVKAMADKDDILLQMPKCGLQSWFSAASDIVYMSPGCNKYSGTDKQWQCLCKCPLFYQGFTGGLQTYCKTGEDLINSVIKTSEWCQAYGVELDLSYY